MVSVFIVQGLRRNYSILSEVYFTTESSQTRKQYHPGKNMKLRLERKITRLSSFCCCTHHRNDEMETVMLQSLVTLLLFHS